MWMSLVNLLVCESYHGDVKEPPEKKRKYTNEDLSARIEEVETRMTAEMRAMENRIIGVVSAKTKLGDPTPTAEDELVERLVSNQQKVDRLNCMQTNALESNQKSQCSVCFEDDVTDVVVVPCFHRTMCWGCWQNVQAAAVQAGQSPRCPSCQVPIHHHLRVI